MVRSPILSTKRIKLDWFYYNHDGSSTAYENKGLVEVNIVMISTFENGSIAHFFANVSGDDQDIILDLKQYNGYKFDLYHYEDDRVVLLEDTIRIADDKIKLSIPKRTFIVLELLKQ